MSVKTTIRKVGINGEGIAFLQKKPVFVPGALLGEEVLIDIDGRNSHYLHACLLCVLREAKHRKVPPCKFFCRCGSCSLMHASYSYQASAKLRRS